MWRKVSSMKPINTIDLTNLKSNNDDDDDGPDSKLVIAGESLCNDTLLFSDLGHDSVLPGPPALVSSPVLSRHSRNSHLPTNSTLSTLSLSSAPSLTTENVPALCGSPVAAAYSTKTIIQKLVEFKNDLYETHSNVVCSALAQQQPMPTNTVQTGRDLFADLLQAGPTRVKPSKGCRIRTRTTIGGKKSYDSLSPIAVRSNVTAVPPYRSHLIEVPGNILAPYAPLTHIPHIRDISSKTDQRKWQSFVRDLRQQATDSGFDTYFEERRIERIRKHERAVAVRAELEPWMQELNIPCVNKSSLNLWSLYKAGEMGYDDCKDLLGTKDTRWRLQDFSECFDVVFGDNSEFSVPISLDEVLELDAYDPVSYTRLAQPVSETGIEKALETYAVLSCQECYSMSCEHGNFDSSFHLLQPSLVAMEAGFSALQAKAIQARPTMRLDEGTCTVEPCQNNCFLSPSHSHSSHSRIMRRDGSPWTAKETSAIESLAGTIPRIRDRRPASCIAAVYLQRSCSEIHDYATKARLFPLPLSPPPIEVAPILPWYDRFKKALGGDWQRRTQVHSPETLIITGPCFHDGPCSEDNCSCVQAKQLCRPACGCTVESCSYKFTGCACHSSGTTCTTRQKGRPCVCLLLGRECDPELCGFCGVKELTMPENRAKVRSAAATAGCQNCELQLGHAKKVVAGQSKIPNVGYGLFAAENIAEGDFVLEYMGEKVAADEGIRRGARRGEGFGDDGDEHDVCSYLFTLLEGEGTWVDAAVFGNKSRYVNHSKETCNLVPRIVHVINAHRIKFVAKRDIQAGEELLFDYGSNFPNLVDLMGKNKASRKLKSLPQGEEERPPPEAPGYSGAAFTKYTAPGGEEEDVGSVYTDGSDDETKSLPSPRRRVRKSPGKPERSWPRVRAAKTASKTAAAVVTMVAAAAAAAAAAPSQQQQQKQQKHKQTVQSKDQGVFRKTASSMAGEVAARKRKRTAGGEITDWDSSSSSWSSWSSVSTARNTTAATAKAKALKRVRIKSAGVLGRSSQLRNSWLASGNSSGDIMKQTTGTTTLTTATETVDLSEVQDSEYEEEEEEEEEEEDNGSEEWYY